MKDYIKRTWKNKIMALLIILIGILSVSIDGDATFLIFAIICGSFIFFAKENWLHDEA